MKWSLSADVRLWSLKEKRALIILTNTATLRRSAANPCASISAKSLTLLRLSFSRFRESLIQSGLSRANFAHIAGTEKNKVYIKRMSGKAVHSFMYFAYSSSVIESTLSNSAQRISIRRLLSASSLSKAGIIIIFSFSSRRAR